jgi:hypothetical protein
MHDNKPNNFYIKHFFIIFQIKTLERLFDTFVPLVITTVQSVCKRPYRLFDKKRLNPQLFYLLFDFNEQKNRRYGFSCATKQP